MDAMFYKLREVNLKLNPNKCCFATKNITFLGHVVSKEGTRPDPGKIEVILHFPEPKTVTNVKLFLGLTIIEIMFETIHNWQLHYLS